MKRFLAGAKDTTQIPLVYRGNFVWRVIMAYEMAPATRREEKVEEEEEEEEEEETHAR